MSGAGARGMLPARCRPTLQTRKEVNPVLNPLAIGVTLGGLLLDVVAPRPKPRIGPREPYPLASQAGSRTPR